MAIGYCIAMAVLREANLVFAISRHFRIPGKRENMIHNPGIPGISRENFLIKKALERVQISKRIWFFYITVTLWCLT